MTRSISPNSPQGLAFGRGAWGQWGEEMRMNGPSMFSFISYYSSVYLTKDKNKFQKKYGRTQDKVWKWQETEMKLEVNMQKTCVVSYDIATRDLLVYLQASWEPLKTMRIGQSWTMANTEAGTRWRASCWSCGRTPAQEESHGPLPRANSLRHGPEASQKSVWSPPRHTRKCMTSQENSLGHRKFHQLSFFFIRT